MNIIWPDEAHPYYVMYATGVSDMPMILPEEIQGRKDFKCRELYVFLPGEWSPDKAGQINSDITQEEYWPIRLIKYLARFPHEYNTWPRRGYTTPDGFDYEPLTPGTRVGGVALVQTGDDTGSIEARDDRKVNFYMVIPAYREEIEYKLGYSVEVPNRRFSEGNLPMVLGIHRPNLCADFKE